MTLQEYIIHWQEAYDRQKSRPTTYAAHGYIFKNHILPKLGDVPLSELTEQRIGEFLEERRKFGGHRPEKMEYPGLSDETMRHIQTLLQQVLGQAVQDGLLAENTAKPFHRNKPKTVKANILTSLEIEDYLDAAEQLGYLPMFMLILTAGLRQRELIALKWTDLNPMQKTLTIHEGRSVVQGRLMEYSSEIRTISLSKEMVELLKLEHGRHPSSPLMFIHPGTLKPYSPNMVRLLHSRISEKAGLDHVRFADLRHSCAVNALQNGMEIRELSQILGHARTSMTRQDYGVYIGQRTTKEVDCKCEEPALDELKEASAQMENLLAF